MAKNAKEEKDLDAKPTAGRELRAEIQCNVANQEVSTAGDGAAKNIFRFRPVLQVVLKHTVEELKGLSYEEIGDYLVDIREDIEVSQGRTAQTMHSETVHMENSESSSINEKRLYFDLLLTIRNPKEEGYLRVRLRVNLEVQQHEKKEGYPLENRGVYYLAREISSQLTYLFDDSTDYKKLIKSYSIWIVLSDMPPTLQNTVISYKFHPAAVYGTEPGNVPSADLMELVMVRLGDGTAEPDNELLEFLYGLFKYNEHSDSFHKFIKTETFDNEPELRKELSEMNGIYALGRHDFQKEHEAEIIEYVTELKAKDSEIKELKEQIKKLESKIPTGKPETKLHQ